MRWFSRLHIKQIGYILLVVFLFQLQAVSPLSAQTDVTLSAQETEPVEETPPVMAYQPPVDADEIQDFAPPDAMVKNLTAELDKTSYLV